jgi:hypothetical protein
MQRAIHKRWVPASVKGQKLPRGSSSGSQRVDCGLTRGLGSRLGARELEGHDPVITPTGTNFIK